METLPTIYNSDFYFSKLFVLLQKLGLITVTNGQVLFTGDQFFFIFKLLAIFISVFCTFLAVDFFFRLLAVRREENLKRLAEMVAYLPENLGKNQRWAELELLLGSENEAELKTAIIEADKMLDELLINLKYQGESLGDRLAAVEKGDMLSLEAAWEAHKYRNKIAHESGFVVTNREARRIMDLYRQVFKEYQFI